MAITDIKTGDIVMDKTAGIGIRVDTTTPTFPWHDKEGNFIPDIAGADAPNLTVFRGGACRALLFTAGGGGNKVDISFHMPHDWAVGTDLFLHIHWFHNGTAISGNFTPTISTSYAKGHNQANFSTEKNPVFTVATPNIATIPQYRHRVDEIQISSAGGSATLLDTSILEPDGIIMVNITTATIPTITGGSAGVFIPQVDLHYQSTNIGTKQKSPNFYV